MTQNNIFKLIHTIQEINNENIIRFTKAFSYPLGISPILVLAELSSKGPQKQVELANTLGYTKGAMTNIAAKLVNLKLTEKVNVENDRRITQLEITSEGEKALEEAQGIGQKLFLQHFNVLDEKEITQYLEIQEKLLTGIKEQKQS
ncbi:MarR family winged helix-turn-helix transcriptional regulator [Sediminibacillus halophilus]|uniref:DNA-binding transcriptional regulator, MarR family n=1 Tax=Sediminibacillus halophilus TaxID=482461 RepID=A0A1G9W8U3_9BACI|nr:MarR family winged helix-turn-helix transcriptional regulator [Sediminibacillus halophilus]SDM80932.1 DNA-binding transcriptional regulator, MarR family [Sediminibacillus halophilus]